MNSFKNFSIKQRFFILFFICITTFIGFGTFALVGLNNLAKLTQNLYNQSSKVSNAAINAKLNLVNINSSIKDVILSSSSDEIQKEINKVAQYESDLQNNLDTIDQNSFDSNTKRNLHDANNLLSKWWKPERDKIIKDVLVGKKDDAIDISKGISTDFVNELDLDLSNIYLSSSDSEMSLIQESDRLQSSERITLISALVILISILTLAFVTMIISILTPINRLKAHMIKISDTGNLEEYELIQNSEISEMARNYNILINKLKNEFWINDARNSLNHEMAGIMSIKELTQKAVNFLCRSLDSGSGAFYIYNNTEKKLLLSSSFAFTERLSEIYELGEGIIGQVALERKAIIFTNAEKNLYAFPLVYEGELQGVIELSSFEPFDKLKENFIEAACSILAINLYSAIQNQKIKDLLVLSENATNEAREISLQLKYANEELEEHERQLQAQTEELQQTNSQLEEQQQILQRQSEELQQTNALLEENQLHIEEQSRLLIIKNEELEESRKEILARSKDYEMANRYKSEFLANISHELRTPLNSIILLSKLLMRGSKCTDPQDAKEKIKIINNSGQHLLDLITDILDLSKIEAGKTDLNYRHFNSGELIEDLHGMFNEAAAEKDIQFILEDHYKDNIHGDKEKISQVLRNFLSNAFKFTDEGSVKLKIERDAHPEDNVVFSVIDTGIGIPPNNLDMIFEEFHQGDGSISRKYGGTGLGLSICRKLSTLMKGKIKASSEPGMGSTFLLHLPHTVSEQAAADAEQETAVTVRSEQQILVNGWGESAKVWGESINEQNTAVKNQTNKRLLVIEDDVNLIQSIKAISDGIGFVTLTSNTGAEGLKAIKEEKIHGILLDLGLPDTAGIDLLKEISKALKLKKLSIPVIIYTGMEISSGLEKEIRLYADSIIIKTTNSHERLLDELTLILHKVKNEKEYMNIAASKINKDKALNLNNKKILIVDDDPRNIFVLAAALEDYDAEIIEAENGKVALEKLEKEAVHLILMDIMMPVMNGYEAIKSIRNTDKLKHIPIIATTAKSLKGDREKCVEAGANDYISKPIDYDVLITLVKAWINKA